MAGEYDPRAAADRFLTQGAQAQNQATVGVPPAAARTALQDQGASGVPAATSMYDPREAARRAEAARGAAAVASHPSVASWVASNPAKAAATRPDWTALGRVSMTWDQYWAQGGPVGDLATAFQGGLRQYQQGLYDYYTKPGVVAGLQAQGEQVLGTAGVLGSPFAPLVEPVARGLYGAYQRVEPGGLRGLVGLPGKGHPVDPEAAAAGLEVSAGLLTSSVPLPHVPRLFRQRPIDLGTAVEVPPEAPLGPSARLTGPEGSVPPPAAPTPPPEFATTVEPSPFTTEPSVGRVEDHPFLQAEAEANLAAVEATQEQIAGLETHGPAPGLVDDFLTNHTTMGEASAWMDPAVLQDLVIQGHDLPPQLTAGLSEAWLGGREIEVPLSTYNTYVAGQPFAQALNAGTRFSDGVSVEEGKALGGEAPAPAQPQGAAPSLAAQVEGAVEEVFRAHGIEQLFKDAAALGMSEEQFARYGEAIDEARRALRERLQAKAEAQIRRERTPEWKEAIARMVPHIEGALNANREVAAARALSEPGFKLDRDWVEQFAPGAASRLPPSILKRGGNHPDLAAEVLGYPDAGVMLNNLADLYDAVKASGEKGVASWVKARALEEATVNARQNLGFDTSPEGITRAAYEEVNMPSIASLLSEDMKRLSQLVNRPFSELAVRGHAIQTFDDLKAADAANPKVFARRVRSLGSKAETALLKGNIPRAFVLKQAQLIQFHQLELSWKYARVFDRQTAQVKGWGSGNLVPGTDPDVGAVMQSAIADLHYPLGRDPAEHARYLQSLANEGKPATPGELVTAMNDEGWGVEEGTVPPDLAAKPGPVPPKLTVDQWRTYFNMLTAMKKFGAEAKSVVFRGKEWELTSIANGVMGRAAELGARYDAQKLIDVRRSAFRSNLRTVKEFVLEKNLRPEVYLHWLDGNTQGDLMRSVVNPLMTGKYQEADLAEAWAKAISDAAGGKGFFEGMDEKLAPPPWMRRETSLGPVNTVETRGQLRMALLHMGDLGAWERLAQGFGWSGAKAEMAEAWIKSQLTPEDVAFAKAAWGENEKLFTLADEMYSRLRGYGLVKSQPRPVDLSAQGLGVLDGGHIRVQYDRMLEDIANTTLVDGAAGTAGVNRQAAANVNSRKPASVLPSGLYGKERVGRGIVNLDVHSLVGGVSEVIHDIAYREALSAAQKVLTDPRVTTAMTSALGPEYRAEMMPWLHYIAQQRLWDSGGGRVVQLARALGSNITFSLIAFRLSSALKHAGIGAMHMVTEVGDAGALAQALTDTIGPGAKAQGWRDFVDQTFGEVRNQHLIADQSMRDAVSRDQALGGALARWRELGYVLFTESRKVEARITALAKYRLEMAKHGNHDLAVDVANKAVRDTQGAGSPVDVAPLFRHSDNIWAEIGQTNFGRLMSFHNTTLQREWVIARQLQLAGRMVEGGNLAGAAGQVGEAGRNAAGFVLLPALWLTAIAYFIFGKREDPKKGAAENIAHQLTWDTLDQLFGGFIGGQQMVGSLEYARKHGGGGEGLISSALSDVTKATDTSDPHFAYNTLRAIGQVSGTVPTQVVDTAQAVQDQLSPAGKQAGPGRMKDPSEQGVFQFLQRAALSRHPQYNPKTASGGGSTSGHTPEKGTRH